MLKVSNLSFKSILHNISFEASSHEVIALLGPNGAGKSTLFKCILGLLPSFTGEVLIKNGEHGWANIAKLSLRERAKLIAYVPQNHDSVFEYQVKEMIVMGSCGRRSLFASPSKLDYEKVEEVAEALGISGILNRNYAFLSGGEKQLVLIARALHQNTQILVMDEPCSSLDYGNQIKILEKIAYLSEKGYTILVSSHNPNHAIHFSKKILALSQGKKVAFGTADSVFNSDLIELLYGIQSEIIPIKETGLSFCVPNMLLKKKE